jgi:squalene-hopene/tetraprenyl-beta-curcumene cyclase
MIDPPTEDVTAHVLEMLAALGYDANNRYVRRGLEYLRATQKPWGSWYGRWGVNHIYGTWCVISALTAVCHPEERAPARVSKDERDCMRSMIDRAVAWLVSVQNPDGGWGETCHSYADESFAGIGASTPSQTAWAVLALQLAGHPQHHAVKRGLAYLCERQRADGTWDELECTGTGFPRDFYINYHLYRHLFPAMALAMDAKLRGVEPSPRPAEPTLRPAEAAKDEPQQTPKEAATP